MLVAALFWKEKRRWYRPALPLVLLLPQVSMYHRGWGRPGDAGFEAEEDGRPVGAVWYRLFTEEHHGTATSIPIRPSSPSRWPTACAATASATG